MLADSPQPRCSTVAYIWCCPCVRTRDLVGLLAVLSHQGLSTRCGVLQLPAILLYTLVSCCTSTLCGIINLRSNLRCTSLCLTQGSLLIQRAECLQ